MSERRPVEAFSPEDMARRRKRSIAMALVLAALMVMFFITTIVRLGSGVLERTL
jgi:accessory gene regulator protein AgrB